MKQSYRVLLILLQLLMLSAHAASTTPDPVLFWQDEHGTVASWRMEGSRRVSSTIVNAGNAVNTSWHVVGVEDFDLDGESDLLWQHDNGLLALWFMNGEALRQSVLIRANPGPEWHVAGVADFDRDGYPDFLLRHTGGTLGVWFMRSEERAGSDLLRPISAGDLAWRVAGCADFDADGFPDLLWQHDGGALAVWYMRGLTLQVAKQLDRDVRSDPRWRVAAVSDLDRNGTPDLVFQHAEGDLGLWSMTEEHVSDVHPLEPHNPNLGQTTAHWRLVGAGSTAASPRYGAPFGMVRIPVGRLPVVTDSKPMEWTPSLPNTASGSATAFFPKQEFYISKHEVTQLEYFHVMGKTPGAVPTRDSEGHPLPSDENRPIDSVSCFDAVEYCSRLTLIDQAAGRIPMDWSYRLPTEEEWEYACRAGSQTRFCFGDSLSTEVANFDGRLGSDDGAGSHSQTSGLFRARSLPTGTFSPNAFGLYDMHGNVAEWCSDLRSGVFATGRNYIARGGSWASTADQCRSDFRPFDPGTTTSNQIGFRIVLSLGPRWQVLRTSWGISLSIISSFEISEFLFRRSMFDLWVPLGALVR